MDFISNAEDQNRQMLQELAISSIDELRINVPHKLWREKSSIDDGLSEYEGLKLLEALSCKNQFQHLDNYLGAGCYEHHVPAIVSAICSKSEFLTAYTPYQAEISQGLLQSIYEYQSVICALTGLDVSNASLYDGPSATAEACLMALRLAPEKREILISGSLHPHEINVIEQYLSAGQGIIRQVPVSTDGLIDREAFSSMLSNNVAAVVISVPNFFGSIDDLKTLFSEAKKHQALTICSANPLVYGIYKSALELGADIAVGSTQCFGQAMQFGGPQSGYIACIEKIARQLPGRIVGKTKDTEGSDGYVLTMQAREQHIRREKATSNICSNQALSAMASLIAILWYGPQGIKELAYTNFERANYLKGALEKINGLSVTKAPIFNEFVVTWNKPIHEVQKAFRAKGIEPGLVLPTKNALLVAVTETKSKEMLDRFIKVAQEI